jgi:peptidoglycan glycosyltransferase
MWQPPTEDTRWLVSLWATAPLMGLAVWLSQPRLPRGLARSVYHLGVVVCIGFVLLSLQLLRQQMVQASAIYNRVEVDPDSGQITSNVRPVLASQRTVRGDMFDRKGLHMVGSETVTVGNNTFARRTYPGAAQFDLTAFGNVLGFYSTRFGQSGLEASQSQFLSGAAGNPIARMEDQIFGRTPVGNSLRLTLNAQLQARAYGLLGGRTGSVVVLNPRTGEVLALTSSPGFDPAQLTFNPSAEDWTAENARISAYWDQLNSDAAGQPLLNRPTQGQYPPGSTFKTVTAVGVLEYPREGDPDNIRCMNELPVEAGAPPVVNAVNDLASLTGDPSNLERVYAYSCNVAFAQYALRLGPDRFTEIARRFDIYSPPDVPRTYGGFDDLLTASSRLFVQPGFLNRPLALADTGYGQGQLLMTPLQMGMVAAAIANDGVMMKPYLVQQIVRPDGGVVRTQQPEEVRRVMSPATAAKMRADMRAVGEYGFGKVISSLVPGVVVGGKSGTAEHAPGLPPHAWFIAIGPVENPRYAVAVMVESGGEGSSVGGTLAGQVLQAAFETE